MVPTPPPPALVKEMAALPPRPQPDDTWQHAPRRHSVFTEAEQEALRFKWIASEQAGKDLGEAALREWVRRYWRGFLRACWLEHLQGDRYWVELDRGDFGFLRHGGHDHPALLAKVVKLLQSGQENLDVIRWAHDADAPVEAVLDILEALDINSRRLLHPFGD